MIPGFTQPGPLGGRSAPSGTAFVPAVIPSAPIAGVANSPFTFPAPGGTWAKLKSLYVQYTLAVPANTILFGNTRALFNALVSQGGSYIRIGYARAMLSSNALYAGIYMDAENASLVSPTSSFNWSIAFPDWVPTVFVGNGQVAYAEVEVAP